MHTSQKIGFDQSFQNGKENIGGSNFGLTLIINSSNSSFMIRMMMK